MSNTPTPAVLKERALFYLDRRLKTLDEVTVDHIASASSGLSYKARRDAEQEAAERNENNAHEREALSWLRAKLVEL